MKLKTLLENQSKYFSVKMPHSWGKRLVNAIESLNILLINADYSDGSTNIEAIIRFDKKVPQIKELNDKIRKALGSSSEEDTTLGTPGKGIYQHWIEIREIPASRGESYE